MTRALGLLVLLVALAAGPLSCRPSPAPLGTPPEGALRIATYNVHYIDLGRQTGAWSVGDWERRRIPFDLAFKAIGADLVAFQEMESFRRGSDGGVNLTLDWLLAQNPGHAAAAVGDWRRFPSTQPILYRTGRLRLEDEGWFFFSETPEVIYSRSFDGSYPAFASWARFRDRRDGKTLRVVNVHFDYASRLNRRLSARLVAERVAPWIAKGERVVLAGDLNVRRGAPVLDTLAAAGLRFLPVAGATYHFNRGLNLFGAIDHIAVSEGVTALGPPKVLRRRLEGEWPSDHYPVIADVRLD